MYDSVTVFARGYNAKQDMEKKICMIINVFIPRFVSSEKTITRKNSAL